VRKRAEATGATPFEELFKNSYQIYSSRQRDIFLSSRRVEAEEVAVRPGEIIGRNITRLRLDRELSQSVLAKRAGLSRVSLGKIERGVSTPREKTLAALARALRAATAQLVTPVKPLERVRFRARRRLNSREQILAQTSIWLSAYTWLEKELGRGQHFELEHLVGAAAPPEAVAARAREGLGLRPREAVRDISGLLEDKGIKLLRLPKASDLFLGLSVGPADGGPAIVVNSWDRISVERWIFTAAHELGHILMHLDAFDRNRADESANEERQARSVRQPLSHAR
jgi:transcriptional regulator with XRE-family HTH domain